MIVRALQRDDVDACEAIVRALPDWFGIEEGIVEARRLPLNSRGDVGADGPVARMRTYAGQDGGGGTSQSGICDNPEVLPGDGLPPPDRAAGVVGSGKSLPADGTTTGLKRFA